MPTNVPLPESILFVITRGDSIGGGQIHVRDFARHLQSLGVRVAVAMGTSGALQSQLDETSIPHFLVPSLRRSINPFADVFAIAETWRIIKRFKPSLVSCHTAKAGLVGRVAAFVAGVPVVFTAHGWQFAEGIAVWQKLLVLMIEAFLARLTKRIITVSAYDRDLALRYRLGSREKVVLVHNGMPWRPKGDNLVAPQPVVRLVMTARFQPQKDHATLFSALKLIEGLPWHLELIGDGPLLANQQLAVNQLGWHDRVQFSGQVMDVPDRLEQADIFVLSSLWEGFPRSILEAMRAGLPVVATEVGGVREAVSDGVTGFVVPASSPEILATKLRTLIENGDLRRTLGDAGRGVYEAEFTFEAMFNKTARVWHSVIQGAGSD